MRNLKKFLALVLAMVMAFSLMLTASAASGDYAKYTDKENITAEFKEAVQVLSGLDILKGDGPDDAKTFRPGDTITRAEAAAIIYRVATRDTADAQVKIYKDYATFTDVNSEDWFAGYVGYCQNAGYIKGKSPTRFAPYETVTGYEMLTMLLRVVGYGQENEFVGGDWQVKVAARSKDLHITDNVKNANFETTLNYAARRDVVADLVFQTMVTVPTVTHNALGYSDRTSLTGEYKNATLGQKNFGLFVDPNWVSVDDWGTPGYRWYRGGEQMTRNGGYIYDNNRMPVYYYPDSFNNDGSLGLIDTGKHTAIATIMPEATKTYNTADIRECDVAHDLEIKDSATFRLYVNRNEYITNQYKIVATDTVTHVGGQGRETKFWYGVESRFANPMPNWCTMVDTYLAKVTKVTDRVLDHNEHVITPAKLYLDVYDGQAVGVSDKLDSYRVTAAGDTVNRNTSAHIASKTGGNWNYAEGDMILVKGYTHYTQNWDGLGEYYGGTKASPNPASNDTGLNHLFNQTEREEAAFEINILNPAEDSKLVPGDKVTPIIGKQTLITWNDGKHTVEGTEYPDAMTLFLDVAGDTTNATYAWYMDKNGNLIGVDYAPNQVNYGVITSIYSAFGQGDNNTDGTAKAIANVLYADGTEGTITIDRFLVNSAANDDGHNVPTTGSLGATMTDTDVASSTWTNTGATELVPVYDNSQGLVMTATAGSGAVKNASKTGWLHVAPVAAVNAAREDNNNSDPFFGIIKGNMFKFVTAPDGKMTAIEVAGDGSNTGVYQFNKNTVPTDGKLFKTYSYVDFNIGASAAGDIWMDADTKILVKNPVSKAVTAYTLDTLPGDVTIGTNEIDWADPDNDGRAEYVYVTGTIEGTITYGLFYFNGGGSTWNGTTGTATGWLNGEAQTLTFANKAQFDLVNNSQAYKGHLFGIQMTNGVVSNVMGNDGVTNTAHREWLLNNETTQASLGAIDIGNDVELATVYTGDGVTTVSGAFQLGTSNVKWNNPYTANTRAIYLRDTGVNGTGNLTYETTGTAIDTIKIDGVATYYLTPNTKVFGIGTGVTHPEGILDYLNLAGGRDVTIVFEEANVKSIVEIYVATDPTNTPSDGTGSGSVSAATATARSMTYDDTNKRFDLILRPGFAIAAGDNVDVTIEIREPNSGLLITSLNWQEGAAHVANADWAIQIPYSNRVSVGTYRVDITITNTAGTVTLAEGSNNVYVP